MTFKPVFTLNKTKQRENKGRKADEEKEKKVGQSEDNNKGL